MQEPLARDGLTPVAGTPEEFANEVAHDTEKYGDSSARSASGAISFTARTAHR